MAEMFSVRVPGTTANCGPGFDTLGIACTIYNELDLTITDGVGVSIANQGEGRETLACDESNVVYKAVKAVYAAAGQPLPGTRLLQGVPVS